MDFAFLIAFTASFLDALPILGTGTVYVPMIILHIIKGNLHLAIYSAILYGVVITIRQMMEPKVLSTQIGVNPLSTLIAMYVGFRLFGVFGLIGGPIMLIMVPTLQKIGLLPKWREKTH
jgi:predicted PurR-regulated permease PerM